MAVQDGCGWRLSNAARLSPSRSLSCLQLFSQSVLLSCSPQTTRTRPVYFLRGGCGVFSSSNARASFPLSLFPVRAACFNIGLRFPRFIVPGRVVRIAFQLDYFSKFDYSRAATHLGIRQSRRCSCDTEVELTRIFHNWPLTA